MPNPALGVRPNPCDGGLDPGQAVSGEEQGETGDGNHVQTCGRGLDDFITDDCMAFEQLRRGRGGQGITRPGAVRDDR